MEKIIELLKGKVDQYEILLMEEDSVPIAFANDTIKSINMKKDIGI
jgi:hypothetical protein